ncbi:MAG: phage holin family protein [Dinghuibacter sp.]|nr:phage holin family protein [Dinghuibacter sp.]
MEKAFEKAEELAGSIKDYLDTRIEIVKINTAEKTAKVISNVLAGIIVAMILFLVLMLASIALGFGLARYTGNTFTGFLAAAGIYLVIGIIVWFARVRLVRLPVMNALIRELFNNTHENDQ